MPSRRALLKPVPRQVSIGFDALMEAAASRAPRHALVTIEEIGNVAAFLGLRQRRWHDR